MSSTTGTSDSRGEAGMNAGNELTRLTGRVVVVAGAGGAAGPSAVRQLAAAGATVVAVDHDEQRLDEVVAAVRSVSGPTAGTATGLVVDLLDERATKDAFAAVVAEHGRIDGLLHLVGGWRGGKGIVESDLADWELLHDLLIRTLQHTSRAAHDELVSAGGRLAIVSTTQAQRPTATNAAYAAAKAAAEAWTLAVADSFAKAAGADADRPSAAATIVQVKALLTDRMREERPDRKFPGYTHVDDLAAALVALFEEPGNGLNGARRSLAP